MIRVMIKNKNDDNINNNNDQSMIIIIVMIIPIIATVITMQIITVTKHRRICLIYYNTSLVLFLSQTFILSHKGKSTLDVLDLKSFLIQFRIRSLQFLNHFTYF
jgi:hypothetical protein